MKLERNNVNSIQDNMQFADEQVEQAKSFFENENNIENAITCLDEALIIYKKNKAYKKAGNTYNLINAYLTQYNQLDEAKQRSINALQYFEVEHKLYNKKDEAFIITKSGIANSYANQGIILTREEDYERARYYFSLSSSVYEHYGNWDNRIQLYINLAGVNKMVGNYNQSLHYLNKALINASSHSNKDYIYNTISLQLGNLYLTQENHLKSIQFYKKSLEYATAREMLNNFSINVFYCLASCFLSLSNLDECKKYLNKAEQLNNESDAGLYDAFIQLLKARIHTKKGNYENAIPYFIDSIKIEDGIGSKTRRLNCINELLTFYNLCSNEDGKNLDDALQYNLDISFEELIGELNFSEIKNDNIWKYKKIYEKLGHYYELQNDYQKAYHYAKKLNALSSKLFKILTEDQVDAMHHNFDIHHLEKQIEVQIESKKNLKTINDNLNNQVKQRTLSLESQNNELKKFANIVAHDLKEPARNINSHIDFYLTKTKGKLIAEEELLLSYVSENSKKLISMMDDLIVYSFLNEHVTIKKSINASVLLNDLLNSFENCFKETTIKIDLEQLPNVKMSVNHLTQLLRRIIRNSLKFKKENKNQEITISSLYEDGINYIKIADKGIGFEQIYESKVFDIFQKLNGEKYNGNGIGLAICKKIIGLYNQEIRIEASEGKGCAVIFSVPV